MYVHTRSNVNNTLKTKVQLTTACHHQPWTMMQGASNSVCACALSQTHTFIQLFRIRLSNGTQSQCMWFIYTKYSQICLLGCSWVESSLMDEMRGATIHRKLIIVYFRRRSPVRERPAQQTENACAWCSYCACLRWACTHRSSPYNPINVFYLQIIQNNVQVYDVIGFL